MKELFFLLCFVVMVIHSRGQNQQSYSAPYYEKGYVQLKDGTVLKGKYVYSNTLEKIRVNSGKNTFVFDASEVERITSSRPERRYAAESDFTDFSIEPPKWFSLTEVGVLAGNPDNSQNAPLVLGSSLNYTFWNNLSAGAGLGLEFLKETYMPVTANLLYRLRPASFTPFVMLQAGYQVPVEDSRTVYYRVVPDYVSSSLIWPGPWPVGNTLMKAKGGILLNPSVGFFSYSRSGYGFSLSAGYRFHRLRYSAENDYNLDIDFNRLSVKLGIIIN